MNVAEAVLSSRQGRCCYGGGRLVGAKHASGLADAFRRQKRDVAGAASDVEYAHALPDSSFAQELPCNRLEEARLGAKAIELVIGVTEDVCRIRVLRVVVHG